jgi:hypothetical protein
MKKIIALLIILALATTSFASGFSLFNKSIKGSGKLQTETRDVDNFNRIKMVGSIDVFITVGKKQSVEISFDDNILDYIETKVQGKTLILDSRKSFSSRKNCKIEITVPKLVSVKLTGSGDININNLDNVFFEYELSGSGNLTAEGKVKDLELYLSGSGDIDTRNVAADDVYAKLSGSGDIKVYAQNNFDGKVSGSGDILYYGNPEKIDTKISGSGSIKRK